MREITINRGNAKWRMRTLGSTVGSSGLFDVVTVPKELKFGENIEIIPSGDPLEIAISTDLGEWIFTF